VAAVSNGGVDVELVVVMLSSTGRKTKSSSVVSKKNIIEAVSCIGSWWAGSWAELDGFGPGKFFPFFLFPLFLLSVSCFWDSNLILKSFVQEFGFRF
jgi:hypothetical protein